MIIPRTITVDDSVRLRLTSQLVILGAGLDRRGPGADEWLAGVAVFEVDHRHYTGPARAGW